MPFTQIEIPLEGGQDTGTETTAGIKPLLMQNCWYQTKNGVRKRYGVTKLDTLSIFEYPSGSLGAPKRVVGTETLPDVPTGMFTSPISGVCVSGVNAMYNFYNNRFVKSVVAPNYVVRVTDATGTTQEEVTTGSAGLADTPSVLISDSAYGSNRYLVVYSEAFQSPSAATFSVNIRINVYNKVDNTLIDRYLVATSITYGARAGDVKVVYASGVSKFFIFYSDSTPDVKVLEYNPATDVMNLTPVSTALAAFVGTNFDVDINPAGTKYCVTDGTTLKFYSTAHALLGTTAIPDGYTPVSCCYGPTGAWVLGFDVGATAVEVRFVPDTTFVLGASTALSAVDTANLGAYYSPSRGQAILAWTQSSNGGGSGTTVSYLYNAVTAASPPVLQMLGTSSGFGGALASKPFEFSYQGATYTAGFIHTRGNTTFDAAGEIVCCFLPIYVGVPTAGLTPIPIANTALRGMLKRDVSFAPGRVSFPTSDVDSSILARIPVALGSPEFASSTVTYLDLYPHANAVAVTACGGNFISGASAQFYDGNQLFESGFYAFPIVQTATQAAGGSLTLAGSYEYTQTFAIKTANGHTIRSSPGIPVVIVLTGANNQFSVTAEKVNISQATLTSNPGYIEFWRTEANRSVLHFEFAVSNAVSGSPYTAAKTYKMADTDLASNAQIYTQGGALENVPPPSCTALCWHKGRLFVGGTPDDSLWFSKQYVSGEIPGFNEGFTLQPFEGGKIKALVSLDSNLVIFKDNAIFGLAGDGPDDTGGGSTYGVPFAISSDTGCLDPKSVVITPVGVMFRGIRGIYLLDRSLQLTYIGKPIEKNLTTDTITDAVVIGRDSQVRFLSDSGEVFVFDYLNGAWSIFTYSVTFKYATWYNNRLYMLTSSMHLYKEDPATCLDDGVFVSMTYRTQYVHKADTIHETPAMGWARIRRVAINGRKLTDCDPTILLYRDYDDSLTEGRVYVANTVGWGAATDAPRTMEIDPATQKCVAISIKYTDTSPSAGTLGTGDGFVLNSLGIEFMVKDGPQKLPSGQVK